MAFDLTQLHVDQSHDTLTKDGKLHRQSQPIAQLAEFTVPTRDPLEPIKQVESALIAELIPMRHERMAASSFAFFRGTAELMAEDLAAQNKRTSRSSHPVTPTSGTSGSTLRLNANYYLISMILMKSVSRVLNSTSSAY